MVEPSNYIDYKLDLPRIPDNLLFTTPTEIRENCELKWDAYVYKTYLAPQELYDWVYTQESIQRELRMYIEDHLQIRYQVMTEQLPIHQDADAKGVDWVLNYHIDLGGERFILDGGTCLKTSKVNLLKVVLIIIWVITMMKQKNCMKK